MSRRDRRQGLAPDAGDSAPRTVLGFTPTPSSQDAGALSESSPDARSGQPEEAAARVDDPPAPPVARFRARTVILHSGHRFDAGSEIPAEAAREMIACGLRVGSEIFKG